MQKRNYIFLPKANKQLFRIIYNRKYLIILRKMNENVQFVEKI